MTAVVKLVIITPKLQTLESDPVWKAVTITKPKPRKVELGPVGPIEDRVGASVTLLATVDKNPSPPTDTDYAYYWSVNSAPFNVGTYKGRYTFNVPPEGLRLVKTVSV